MKINACKEKVLKPKSNLAFSVDLLHLNLITQPCLFLKIYLIFRLMLTSKGEVSSLKRCSSTVEVAVGRSLTKTTVSN